MIQDMKQFEATMVQAKEDPHVPELALWLIETLGRRFATSTACTHLNLGVRTKGFCGEDEKDALFSLNATNGRSADVWIEWGDEELVNCGIVIHDGVENPRTARWSPEHLVAWLDGVDVKVDQPVAPGPALSELVADMDEARSRAVFFKGEMTTLREERNALLARVDELEAEQRAIGGDDSLGLLREGRRLAIEALGACREYIEDRKGFALEKTKRALEYLNAPPSRQRQFITEDEGRETERQAEKRAVLVEPRRPFVVRTSGECIMWVTEGRGWLLEEDQWIPLDVAPGLGGIVLTASEFLDLVARVGYPEAT